MAAATLAVILSLYAFSSRIFRGLIRADEKFYRLVCTFFKQRSPITTRIELACLGLLAVLWLSLGSYLAASESGEADVECFSAGSSLEDPVEFPGCEYSCAKAYALKLKLSI